MNFIFISPHFPHTYWEFCNRLRQNGVNVFAIADAPYDSLCRELKEALTEAKGIADFISTWIIENNIDLTADSVTTLDSITTAGTNGQKLMDALKAQYGRPLLDGHVYIVQRFYEHQDYSYIDIHSFVLCTHQWH